MTPGEADGVRNLFVGAFYRTLLSEKFIALYDVGLPHLGGTLPVDGQRIGNLGCVVLPVLLQRGVCK
jgi:hypothetical protein